MSAHTPGPWQVEEAYSQVGKQRVANEYFVRRDGDSTAIASEICDPVTGEPSEANARLIAASPLMFETLRFLGDGRCACCGGWQGEHSLSCRLNAAIRAVTEASP